MTITTSTFLMGVVFGAAAVASNPSPYFAAFGLVVAAGMGCGLLVGCGGHFMALVLFLLYLGGMLVVFAYSAALAAEPYPESWGSSPVALYSFLHVAGVWAVSELFLEGWGSIFWVPVDEYEELCMLRGDLGGIAVMYEGGGSMLVVGAWVLLLALLVVFDLARGLKSGSMRVEEY
uniref:NADH-ubiquinone oxidoreductase chain 6 n=1 Tax=Pennahia aneus TaxID=3051908 RepID=A0A896Z353_9TELE|nr:NADH dehydrogenase subunit 6 [Pennahia anea]